MSIKDYLPENFIKAANYLLGSGSLPDSKIKKEVYFGDGYSYEEQRSGVKITIPDASRSGHFWCFGTTRVGKTRLLENMVEEDIRKGYDVLVLDPKGDGELFSKISQVAIETGRKDDLMLLNPVFPEYSIKLNPLEYYSMKEELVGHIMAAVPDGKEPFFKNVAYETTINAITAFIRLAQIDKETEIITFSDLKELVDKTGLEQMLALLESRAKEGDKETEEVMLNLKKIAASEKDYFSKISSSLRVALMELTVGNTGELIGKVRGNEFIRRLETNSHEATDGFGQKREGAIFVVQAGSLLSDRAAKTMGKVMISTVAKLAGRIFASGKKLSRPLCVYVDEAQSMLYQGIDDVFAKAGGAGVWLHCFSQSINQIYEVMGKDAGKSILDNTNTKLFMRAPDQETADNVSKFFGNKKIYESVMAINNGNLTARESEDLVVTPRQIQSLKPRQFFAISYNGMFRGEVRKVSKLYLSIEYPIAVNKGV